MKHALPLSNKDFNLFQQFLIAETGLYFDDDRDQSLRFALWERANKRGYSSYEEYYNLLKHHPEGHLELRELLAIITTGETYFFRNIAQFKVLMKDVLPEIIQKKRLLSDHTLKVWSAGSSKGDEAYSIAIAIMETLPDYRDWNISILGTDINKNVLEAAQEGIYSTKDVGELPKEYLEKYFKKMGSAGFLLSPEVKRLARFEYHNLAKDSFYLEGMCDLDLIFCRNVTIYFGLDTTKRLINNFYDCLSPNRYLFLGHSETLWQINDKFETIEYPNTFIYKKPAYGVKHEPAKIFIDIPVIKLEEKPLAEPAQSSSKVFSEFSSQPAQVTPKAKEEPGPVFAKANALFNEKKFDESLELFDKVIAHNPNNLQALFAKAVIWANQEKYEDSFKLLAKVLEKDIFHVEAIFLQATLEYRMKKYLEAETLFRKVLYLDSEAIMAYFNLGNIYLAQKKFSKAALEFKNAIRFLEKGNKDDEVRFSENFTCGFLLKACKQHLDLLTGKRGGGIIF
ncbi:MAG: tetratricopeptide repeat protein [Candidatus Omnitrophica bacterium]|nr:tetratricopeptide repeat protein [Candidatus Omnitrophota bacterium]